MTTKAKS